MNNGYEFTKVVDLMKYVEEEWLNENNEIETIIIHKPIKKNFKIKWICTLDKINDFQEYYNDEGQRKKDYTTLRHNDYGEVVVKESYEKLKNIVLNNKKQIGFYGTKQ